MGMFSAGEQSMSEPMPSEGAPARRRLGDFEIVREIGRGGMGIVYEARQVSLNRKVALKVLGGVPALAPKAVQRFHREAEAAARLHHTNIVPIYATGEQDGVHYYAMELIEGPSLDLALRQLRQARANVEPQSPSPTMPEDSSAGHPASTDPYVNGAVASGLTADLSSTSLGWDSHYFDNVARMVAEVADALDYAHQQGVIHRDIKPSNLLVSPVGRLSVNDFGLARLLEQPGVTISGEFVGTPRYLSPEQIGAGRVPLDHRTDIYSLGATLYELLTLQPPFPGVRRDQVLAQVLHKEPERPRRLNKRVPIDLETICLKAMDKDPDRRYQTAGRMAEDLRRYGNRLAISARRAGPIARSCKWLRRRPALAATLAGAVLLALLTVFFGYQAHLAEQLRDAEQTRHERELRDEHKQRALDDAIAAAMSGDFDRAGTAIRAAELQGVSPGQGCWLRGLVHYQSGDTRQAIADLEHAVQLLPDSLAPRALLALSCARVWKFGRSAELFLEMAKLTPATSEDFLFRGYAEMTDASGSALQDLGEAIRRRDSPIARAIRARVRASYAMDRGDLHEAERALPDARTARDWLPDNPFTIETSIFAHLVAANLHGEDGARDKQEELLREAKSDVRALERLLPCPSIGFWGSAYYQQIGDQAAAHELCRRAAEGIRTNTNLVCYAVALYEQGRFEDALKILDRRKEKDDVVGDVLRTYCLAERPDKGPAQAYEAYKEMPGRYSDSPLYLAVPSVLLLLGRRAEATKGVENLTARLDPARDPGHLLRPALAYIRGELPEKEFHQSAGASRVKQCYFHCWAAMVHLADGDRSPARDHFRQAVATQTFFHPPHTWSQMLLRRMEKDPRWPTWIPAKP
jgi:serine/threonine protein kinase